jgi:hypothetical protein
LLQSKIAQAAEAGTPCELNEKEEVGNMALMAKTFANENTNREQSKNWLAEHTPMKRHEAHPT